MDKILFSEQQILDRTQLIANQINQDYKDKQLTLIAILNGSVVFFADLIKKITIPMQIDCLGVSSYEGTKSTGNVVFRQNKLQDFTDRHILLVDDILDTGLTLKATTEKFLNETNALSVNSCVLLSRKNNKHKLLIPRYTAFEISNEFVVGYGLDYNEEFRNLPHIEIFR